MSSAETNAHPHTAENKRLEVTSEGFTGADGKSLLREAAEREKTIRRSERRHVFATCLYKSVSMSLNAGGGFFWEGMCDNGKRLASAGMV